MKRGLYRLPPLSLVPCSSAGRVPVLPTHPAATEGLVHCPTETTVDPGGAAESPTSRTTLAYSLGSPGLWQTPLTRDPAFRKSGQDNRTCPSGVQVSSHVALSWPPSLAPAPRGRRLHLHSPMGYSEGHGFQQLCAGASWVCGRTRGSGSETPAARHFPVLGGGEEEEQEEEGEGEEGGWLGPLSKMGQTGEGCLEWRLCWKLRLREGSQRHSHACLLQCA